MIEKIDHVGIAVPSIEEAVKLYEALGMEVEGQEEVPAEGVRVAMIRCGESRIELLEPTTEVSPIAKFLAQRGGGVHHICLATTDIRADQRILQAEGFQLLRPEPTRGAGGCWVQFIHPKSAAGVLVELSETDKC
jgi:methylmalonyl-CoA/ethylmalonyl-CoA epimerase